MPELRKNTERHRYEAVQDGQVQGYAVYRDVGGAVELPHTVVEPAYGGQGVARAWPAPSCASRWTTSRPAGSG